MDAYRRMLGDLTQTDVRIMRHRAFYKWCSASLKCFSLAAASLSSHHGVKNGVFSGIISRIQPRLIHFQSGRNIEYPNVNGAKSSVRQPLYKDNGK